jgi:hypothetical protein
MAPVLDLWDVPELGLLPEMLVLPPEMMVLLPLTVLVAVLSCVYLVCALDQPTLESGLDDVLLLTHEKLYTSMYGPPNDPCAKKVIFIECDIPAWSPVREKRMAGIAESFCDVPIEASI